MIINPLLAVSLCEKLKKQKGAGELAQRLIELLEPRIILLKTRIIPRVINSKTADEIYRNLISSTSEATMLFMKIDSAISEDKELEEFLVSQTALVTEQDSRLKDPFIKSFLLSTNTLLDLCSSTPEEIFNKAKEFFSIPLYAKHLMASLAIITFLEWGEQYNQDLHTLFYGIMGKLVAEYTDYIDILVAEWDVITDLIEAENLIEITACSSHYGGK